MPASDRIVRIDHICPDYRASVEGLEKLEEKLRGLNDYPDPEDKEQQLAEIYAMRPLMSAVRVRVAALIALVVTGLTLLIKKVRDEGLSMLAKTALALIGKPVLALVAVNQHSLRLRRADATLCRQQIARCWLLVSERPASRANRGDTDGVIFEVGGMSAVRSTVSTLRALPTTLSRIALAGIRSPSAATSIASDGS